jgi:hypothetical protein
VGQAGGAAGRQPPAVNAQPPPAPFNLGPTLPRQAVAEQPAPAQNGVAEGLQSNKSAAQLLKERMLKGAGAFENPSVCSKLLLL